MDRVGLARLERGAFRLAVVVCCLSLLAVSCRRASDDDAGPSISVPLVNIAGGSVNGPPDAAAAAVHDGGRVVLGLEGEPEKLDPVRYAFSSSGHMIASAVYDPLATIDANGVGVPYLATAIEPSNGFSTWTITLPSNVSFHNGEKLSAQVVVDNLRAYQKSIITGLTLSLFKDFSAVDSTHVVLNFNHPIIALPSLLSTQIGYVMAPKMLEPNPPADRPIGTGPFVYDDHVKDQFWVFKKNPNYWRPGLPHLDSIEFQPIPDDQKRLAALESGDIDIMHTLRPAQVQLLRQQQGQFKMVENNAGEEEMILLNTQKEPFNSLTARQAVAAATDTAGWRHDLMFDVAQAVNSPFAPGQPGYEPDNGYPKFDMAKAKQLVKQYESENKGKKLSFEYATQDDISNSNEGYYFKALYEEAGMEVVVHPLPQINLLGLVAPGHYQASRFRLFGNTNPDVDSRFWLSTSVLPEPNVSLNFPRWVDTSVDSDIYKAMGSTDEGVRDTAYKNIGRNFAKNLPYLWLGRSTWLLAASPRVNGIYSAANGTIDTIGAKTWISELSIDL